MAAVEDRTIVEPHSCLSGAVHRGYSDGRGFGVDEQHGVHARYEAHVSNQFFFGHFWRI